MLSPTVSASSGAAVDLSHRNFTHPSSLVGPPLNEGHNNHNHNHNHSKQRDNHHTSNSNSDNSNHTSSNNHNNNDISSKKNHSSNDEEEDIVLSEYTAQLIVISFLVKRVAHPLMEQLRRRLFAMELGTLTYPNQLANMPKLT